jgi:hypothetical protein
MTSLNNNPAFLNQGFTMNNPNLSQGYSINNTTYPTFYSDTRTHTYRDSNTYGDVTFTNLNITEGKLSTIKAGINIYHGSEIVDSFNPNDIKLEQDVLVSLFSNNISLAGSRMGNCSNYPDREGYIHAFYLDKDLNNVKILSKGEMQRKNSDIRQLNDMYCNGRENPRLDAFAYYIERENTDPQIPSRIVYDLIIGICNPNDCLKYQYTQKCVYPYTLSEKQNPNAYIRPEMNNQLGMMNPAMMNPNIMNPALMNPSMMTPAMTNPAMMNSVNSISSGTKPTVSGL